MGDSATKHFELDVVAVLGYQVVVVSCDMSNPSAARYNRDSPYFAGTYETSIKRKTIEAYHRTKQLGGDEGRTIMLCQASQDVADDITDDLHDTIGTDHKPLQVWGKDTWPTIDNPDKLVEAFKEYLKELGWK